MDLVIHHLKKDIRHLRSLLALWFLLLLVNSVLLRTGLDRFVASDEGIEVLATAYVLLYVLQQILQIVIVCRLVQADALAGTTAFWLTRPISRKELLLSKSLFVLLILVLPSLLAEVVVLRVNGIPVSFIFFALAQEVILQSALFLVPAMLVAALTPNLVRLVVAGLASVIAFFLIHYAVLASVMAFGAGPRRQLVRFFPGDWPAIFPTTPSGMLVSAILMIGLGVIVICYQYVKRRTGNSAASAALGMCFVVTTLNFWPWDLRTFSEGLPARSGLNPEGVKLVVHREMEARSVIGDSGKLTIFGKVEFQGIPPSFFLELAGFQATLRLPDGTLLPSSSDYPLFFGEGFQFDKEVTVLNEPSPWPKFTVLPLLSVDAQTFQGYDGTRGTYVADASLDVYRRLTATLPLVLGSRVQGSSGEITLLSIVPHEGTLLTALSRFKRDGFVVTLRESGVRPWLRRTSPAGALMCSGTGPGMKLYEAGLTLKIFLVGSLRCIGWS